MTEKRRAWNSTLPAPQKAMQRSGPIKARGRPRFKVSGKRDEPFRDFIRSQPCLLAGKPGHTCKGVIECAHVQSKGAGGTDRSNCVALCSKGHSESHLLGRFTFERIWNISLQAIATALDAVYRTEEGWPE